MGDLLTDALTFRRVVEAGAAETAARATLSRRQREELTASLAAVEAAQLAGYRQADTRLHLAIAEAAGSPLQRRARRTGRGSRGTRSCCSPRSWCCTRCSTSSA